MPQIKRREKWIELPEEYEGFEVRVWVNAPAKLWSELQTGNEERARAALSQIVLEHNNWLDFDGEPFPAANEPDFWEAIPTELAALILVAVQQEIQSLPNSIAPRRRR